MRTIAVAAQKGGVGKTTATVNLACLAGRKTVVIDLDAPQGDLRHWHADRKKRHEESGSRAALRPALATVRDLKALPDVLEKARDRDAEWVFIDTPPAVGPSIREMVRVADLVLIPTPPAKSDMRSVRETAKACHQEGVDFAFLPVGADPRARNRLMDARGVLARWGEVCPATVYRRAAHERTKESGGSVGEDVGDGLAANVWRAVFKWLKARVRENGA